MKKRFSMIGMFAGGLMFLMGVLFLTGAFGGKEDSYVSVNRSSTYHDYGYASFGADFYTYVTNNAYAAAESAYEAALAGAAVANQVAETAKIMRLAGGFMLMFVGLFGICGFGISYSKAREDEQKTVAVKGPQPIEPDSAPTQNPFTPPQEDPVLPQDAPVPPQDNNMASATDQLET